MSGYAVQEGATVRCTHGGWANPTVVNQRVRLGGGCAINLPSPWMVANCTPPSGPSCATAGWTAGSIRVRSLGVGFVVQGGTATCAPTGSPLAVVDVQTRVRFT